MEQGIYNMKNTAKDMDAGMTGYRWDLPDPHRACGCGVPTLLSRYTFQNIASRLSRIRVEVAQTYSQCGVAGLREIKTIGTSGHCPICNQGGIKSE
jgi:hypothetical protein